MVSPIYWRRHVISVKTICIGEALQQIHNALPIPQDITFN